MAMGIIVTGFTLFGMLALVILDASLEEPTQENQAKPRPRARMPRQAAETRTHKRAA
jgi:hypothetical protein